jgi:hypothetical protein
MAPCEARFRSSLCPPATGVGCNGELPVGKPEERFSTLRFSGKVVWRKDPWPAAHLGKLMWLWFLNVDGGTEWYHGITFDCRRRGLGYLSHKERIVGRYCRTFGLIWKWDV